MTIDQTAGTLDSLALARERTRSVLDRGWFAFVAWGAVVLASAPVQLLLADTAIVAYWIAAPIGAVIVTSRWFSKQARVDGIEPRYVKLYIATGAIIAVGCFVTGAMGEGGTLSAVGPPLILSAGLLVFAFLDRDFAVAASAALITIMTLIIWAIDPAEMTFWSALSEGTILLATGFWCRARAAAAL